MQMKAHAVLAWLVIYSAAMAAEPIELVTRHCGDCHGADTQEADLDLMSLLGSARNREPEFEQLSRVLEVLRNGEMPPVDSDSHLENNERQALTEWLMSRIESIATAHRDDPGTVVMPRLTRHEYRNVLRDLSGGVVTRAGEYLPNEGGAGEGFANVGQAQGMNAIQFEKYLEAAKGSLQYLRAYPEEEFVWHATPRGAVDDPKSARQEAVDDIISWYVGQQQKWGEFHRDDLQKKIGINHAAYLEAAWQYRHRAHRGLEEADFSDIARSYEVPLAPVVLEKWYHILSAEEPLEPFEEWGKAWQTLPAQGKAEEIRRRCAAIVEGAAGTSAELIEDFAPPYEISFHEAKEEVLAAAKEGYWPFRVDTGKAEFLYLLVTDGGDGNRGEHSVWRKGSFQFADGTFKHWQDVSTVVGANSGKHFPFGKGSRDGEELASDHIGVRPPGMLKVKVPQGATLFEVELALDGGSIGNSTVQAVVLHEPAKSQRYLAGRPVFGGKASTIPQEILAKKSKELQRALRKRNVSEANRTKVGLNAERNVLSNWTFSPVEFIGGPWPDQDIDKNEPASPYHFTAQQVRENATTQDLAVLASLEKRLISITQIPQQEALAFARSRGFDTSQEGFVPDGAEFDGHRLK